MKKIITKYNALSLPTKAALWFTFANFVIKGVAFITVPLFTRYLSTEEYGIVSVFLSYQQILLIFATFEMYSGAYIRGLLRYKSNTSLFTYSEQLLSSLITICIFVISIPILPWFIEETETNKVIYALMFIYFLFFPAYQCWANRKRFEYDYKPVVITAILYSIITTVIPLAAIIVGERTAIIRITYMLISEALFCLPFYIKNVRPRYLASNRVELKEQWKFLLSFQGPSVVHSLSFLVLSQADRVMIGDMVGKSEAGIYSVAYSIASVITVLSVSSGQVLKPWRYQKMESKDYFSIKRNSNFLLIGFGTMIILWILIAPEFMHFLFPDSYYNAVWIIPPVSMGVFFMFLYSMFVDIEEYFYKTKYTMYATLICASLNILLNYIGIKMYGYMACAYTTLICYVLFAILHCFWANKAVKPSNISIGQIFDLRVIIGLSIFFLICEIALTFAYRSIIVRYIVFSFIIIIAIINRKNIKKRLDGVINVKR